jgi:hypothetical protein
MAEAGLWALPGPRRTRPAFGAERLARGLFVVVALELFLGGGGRLVDLGPASLRMTLFGLALAASLVLLAGRRILDSGVTLAVSLVAGFVLVHAGPIAIGLLGGQAPAYVATDVKPLTFILIAPFFALCLGRRADVERAATLLRFAGLVLAITYLMIWAGLTLKLLPRIPVYDALTGTGEVMFRTETTFFYKGFLYLCIGVLFSVSAPGRLARFAAVPIVAALLLSMTRGLVMSAAVGLLLMLSLRDRRALLLAIPFAAAILMSVLWVLPELNWAYAEQRALSNSVRSADHLFFLERSTPFSLLFGAGFGTPLNGRALVENTYLWIVWKAGLPGLAVWLAPLAIATRDLRRAWRRPDNQRLAAAYWSAVVLVYVQTATNPFLTNPIGLSMVLVSVFSLHTLARHDAD